MADVLLKRFSEGLESHCSCCQAVLMLSQRRNAVVVLSYHEVQSKVIVLDSFILVITALDFAS